MQHLDSQTSDRRGRQEILAIRGFPPASLDRAGETRRCAGGTGVAFGDAPDDLPAAIGASGKGEDVALLLAGGDVGGHQESRQRIGKRLEGKKLELMIDGSLTREPAGYFHPRARTRWLAIWMSSTRSFQLLVEDQCLVDQARRGRIMGKLSDPT